MTLIAPSELLKAFNRIQEREAEPAPAQRAFRYVPRSHEQWFVRANQTASGYVPRTPEQIHRRAHQSYKSDFGPMAQPAKPITPSEVLRSENILPANDAPKKRKAVTASSLCMCSHRYDGHNRSLPTPPLKPTPDFGDFSLITSPCEMRVWKGNKLEPCPCLNYCDAESKKLAPLKRPRADDYTPCGHCGHLRSHHCHARKPSKARKPKREWLGFATSDGQVFMCKHTPADAQDYRCTSTSCAHSSDGVSFCDCEKFVNPLAKPRAQAAKPRKPRTKKTTAFVTGVFPTPGAAEQITGEQA